jgi:hypothetical protein
MPVETKIARYDPQPSCEAGFSFRIELKQASKILFRQLFANVQIAI